MDLQAERSVSDSHEQPASPAFQPARSTLRGIRPSRRNSRNDWSSEELRRLRELAASGTPVNAIAGALRRTTSAIKNKAGMQGISLRTRRHS